MNNPPQIVTVMFIPYIANYNFLPVAKAINFNTFFTSI